MFFGQVIRQVFLLYDYIIALDRQHIEHAGKGDPVRQIKSFALGMIPRAVPEEIIDGFPVIHRLFFSDQGILFPLGADCDHGLHFVGGLN